MIPHFRERAAALEALGWTGPDAEWLALVCLHSGVFLRRSTSPSSGAGTASRRRGSSSTTARGAGGRRAGGRRSSGRGAGRRGCAWWRRGRCTGRWGPSTCGTGARRRRRWYCGGCCRRLRARTPGAVAGDPDPHGGGDGCGGQQPRHASTLVERHPYRKPRRFSSIQSAASGANPSGTDRHGRSRALHWPEWRWGRPATTGRHNRCG